MVVKPSTYLAILTRVFAGDLLVVFTYVCMDDEILIILHPHFEIASLTSNFRGSLKTPLTLCTLSTHW